MRKVFYLSALAILVAFQSSLFAQSTPSASSVSGASSAPMDSVVGEPFGKSTASEYAPQYAPVSQKSREDLIPTIDRRPAVQAEVIGSAGGFIPASQTGFSQPGYYQPVAGNPYFYSLPGQTPAAPLSGLNGSGYQSGYNGFGYNGFGAAAGTGGDAYNKHFGPGFYRSGDYGHHRFPYYSYRRPWFYPGFDGYNRDTNLPW